MAQWHSKFARLVGDFSALEVRFFLRLLYTGRMDPNDWPTDDPPYEHEQLPTLPGSLVSQPPATTEPVLPLDGRQSFAGSSHFRASETQVLLHDKSYNCFIIWTHVGRYT